MNPLLRVLPLFCCFALGELSASAESFVLFESGHVRPLALSPSGDLLFAVNTPDNRVEVLRTENGSLARAGETVVGLEPVAVAALSETEVWVVNHLSDSVSVVDVTEPDRPFVRATLLVGDEPRDIVVGGPARDRVFVTSAHRGQNRPGDPGLTTPGVGRADVWVFDAGDLEKPAHVLTLFCDTPRALAVSSDGSRVFAAAFHSGNRTTVLNAGAVEPISDPLVGDGFEALDMPPPLASDEGVPAPATGLILRFDGERWVDSAGRDWSPRVRFDLPDRDVFVIDATRDPPREVAHVSGVGTVLFNMAVNPADGRLYVSNIESRNHVRFEPELRGHVVENRVTIIEGTEARPVHLNPHIDYSNPSGPAEEIDDSLAFPLGMEFSADGERLYVAAFSSAKVGVLDGDGNVTSRIDVGGGPSGLALHEAAGRLYVMNRFDHSVSVVDPAIAREVDVLPLRYNPEPPPVREGRPFLYDARISSGHGDASCASCHVFADFDSLAWDLGDPAGTVELNPLVVPESQGDAPLSDFHPMKGPMTTQSLRGLAGAGAMHWRGDRNGGSAEPFSDEAAFLAFRPAFQGLLGRQDEFPLKDMEKFMRFALAVRYPPNPIAPLDGSLTQKQEAGKEIFLSDGNVNRLGGDGSPCRSCHVLPLSTAGNAIGVRGTGQSFKVPHLRNLYQKVGMFGYALPGIVTLVPRTTESTPTPHRGDQVRGFGFAHDGSFPTISDFFRQPLTLFGFKDEPGRSGLEKIRELESFLLAFPTGLAPAVGQQVTLDAAGLGTASERYRFFETRADAGDGDLVIHGVFAGERRGFLYLGKPGGAGRLQSDRREEVVDSDGLLEAISSGGAVLTATLVPSGSGRRIAIDRDEDGFFDLDEADLGFDSANPASRPPLPLILRGDCNGDGSLDLSDAIFSFEFLFLGGPAPACVVACNANDDEGFDLSDPIHALTFLFRGGPAPGSYPHCEPGTGDCVEVCAP